MISLRGITLRRGPDPLVENASLTLHPGHHAGLVGPNGSGKSSLFALLQGELSTDAGDADLPSHWVIAHMAQETPALDRPAIEHVLDGDPELRTVEADMAAADASGDGRAIAEAHARCDAIDGYTARVRAAELLSGLGFPAAQHDQPVASFSGGWRVRLNLARALMCRSDLLLLDEPTNHLDLEAVLWLEQWLRAYPGTLLLISHDRDFLDAVADEIIHVEQRALHHYIGGYSEFERQRAERLAQQQSLYEKQQQEVAHLQRFIDRFRAKATKARAAQSRIKTLERMEKLAPAHVDSPFRFDFAPAPEVANPMLSLQGVALGYGDRVILEGIDLGLAYGTRLGLLGPNGAGKSTLIRALAGRTEPLAGEVVRARNLRIGYFAQHQFEQLDGGASPLQHLRRLSPESDEQRMRDFLGGFGFRGDQASDSVGRFSGGEKSRLVLAILVWQAPNLLLLDEPTNHLDLDMRHALTVALQGFDGAVVTVSHDRHLLNSTVDDYCLVSGGGVRRFDGDLNDYRHWLSQHDRAVGMSDARLAAGGGANSAATRKAARRREAQRRAELRPLRDRVGRLLLDIEAIDAELSDVEERLGDASLYEEEARPRLDELLRSQRELRSRHQALESEWMQAEEALESARAGV